MDSAAKSTGLFILKAGIAAVSIGFIYIKVNNRSDFEMLANTLKNGVNDSGKLPWLLTIVFLMMVNWVLETAKWKLLLKYISPTGWLRCFRSVLSGVTVSLFTPNRIGEFAGRVLHLDRGIRIKAAIASVIGSMNQLLITIIAGGFSLLASLHLYVQDDFIYRTINTITAVTMVVVVFFYFRIPGLSRFAEKFKSLRGINLYTSLFEKYKSGTLLKLTCLSALRYGVFTIQFILMLRFFSIIIPLSESIQAIALMYLVLAIVPSLAISELTTRGSVALFLFSSYTANSAGILAVSGMIWFINLVVPACLGALAAFYFRFNNK